jgi:hypothetical protein
MVLVAARQLAGVGAHLLGGFNWKAEIPTNWGIDMNPECKFTPCISMSQETLYLP